MIATAEPETSPKTKPGRATSGRFMDGHKFSKGNPMSGRVEKFRAVLLEVAQERFPEVAAKLLDLAAEGERWAVELVFDRCLGKVPDPRDAAPTAMNQININLPDPPGGRHVVPGLLDADP